MAKSVDEHYDIIKQKLVDLRDQINECLLETSYLAVIELNTHTTLGVDEDGDVILVKEPFYISFDQFKKIGKVVSQDDETEKIKDKLDKDSKEELEEI